MLDSLSCAEIAATVKMMRAAFSGTILMVEGPNDQKFLTRFIDDEQCRMLAAHGKQNALGAYQTLLSESSALGVLVFIDADFARIDGELPTNEAIIVSDHHDTEMMMLLSPAFDKILREYGSTSKVPTFCGRVQTKSILEHLLLQAARIAHLRHQSLRNGWNLRFEKIDYGAFVECKQHLAVDCDALVRAVLANGGGVGVSYGDARRSIPDTLRSMPLGELCCGHDVTMLLALGLRQCLGSQPPQIAKRENLEKVLRIAYEEAFWVETEVYAAIRRWENSSQPYRVLTDAGPPIGDVSSASRPTAACS